MGTQAYVKSAILGFAFMALVFAPPVSPTSMQMQYAQAMAGENSMAKIQLILKKLRGSMTSIKDFDELEDAGMSKRDVDRMRHAMGQKIKQLTDEAITSIQDL